MKKMLMLVVPLALAACSAETKFVPRGQDLAGTAHLIADSDTPDAFLKEEKRYMIFQSVDDKPIHGYWDMRPASNELYLMPGKHTFEVSYQHGGSYAIGRFAIDAKAGVIYRVHHQVKAYSVRMWVTEGENGTAAAATPLPRG